MKVTCSIFFLLLYAAVVSAQIDNNNKLRAGDEIIKQQVEYKDPGRSGENVIWNFGKLKSVNDEYKLIYSAPPLIDNSKYILGWDTIPSKETRQGELIIGTEHNTMYYYRYKDNSLLLLGHENPVVKLAYAPPIQIIPFPFNYGQEISAEYKSEGLYSGTVAIETEGQIAIQADAYGKMILPSGDTLNHVLRIKTIRTIVEYPNEYTDADVNIYKVLETYQWYTKGYRYPIFETIRNLNQKDSTEIFTTAFFYPPQDHFYLDDDLDNLAVLDSLWNLNKEVIGIDTDNPIQHNPLTYNFYPNPVETTLHIEYYLDMQTPVTINLYALDGRLAKTITKPIQQTGLYYEQIDCTGLSQGTYILRIQTNTNTITSDKIIKK